MVFVHFEHLMLNLREASLTEQKLRPCFSGRLNCPELRTELKSAITRPTNFYSSGLRLETRSKLMMVSMGW